MTAAWEKKQDKEKKIKLGSWCGACLHFPGPFLTLFLRLKFLYEKDTRKHVTASCSPDKYVWENKLCKNVTHGYSTLGSKYELSPELHLNSALIKLHISVFTCHISCPGQLEMTHLEYYWFRLLWHKIIHIIHIMSWMWWTYSPSSASIHLLYGDLF